MSAQGVSAMHYTELRRVRRATRDDPTKPQSPQFALHDNRLERAKGRLAQL